MIKVTANSNIHISALISRQDNPSRLIDLGRAGKLRLAVSDSILDEVSDVLARKFSWPPSAIVEVRREIEGFTEKVKPSVVLDVVKEDPDDNRILECASAAGSDYIVTAIRIYCD